MTPGGNYGKATRSDERGFDPQGLQPHTQRAYLRGVRHFVRHYMRSPHEMEQKEVRDFLLNLVRDRNASPGTLDMYVNAQGLSHPKRPKTLRSFSVRQKFSESLRPSAR
jgi:hypothetical protein